jgi:thiol-disulfide isomerase/thioredoxin
MIRTLALTALLTIPAAVQAAPIADIARPDVTQHFGSARVHVVNVWATWCIPCVEEIPDLRALDDAFTSAQVQFIGISLDDAIPGKREESRAKVARFLQQKKVTYRNFYYTGAIPLLQDFYRFEGEIPLTVIYDRHGKERARHQGRLDRATVLREINALLKETTRETK